MQQPGKIKLVVSDIDGTLLRHDKTLHPETIKAAQELRAAGIALCLVSSRPPKGIEIYLDPLGIDTPRAAFNGGLVMGADGAVLEELVIPEAAARQAVQHMEEAGLDIWVFTASGWFIRDPNGPYVAHEAEVTTNSFTVVPDFEGQIAEATKIMASSKTFDLVAAVEADLQKRLGDDVASVNRSSPYYVDVTNPKANKGQAAQALARILGVADDAMCCLGDMPVDIPMLRIAGLSVAMGQSPESVKKAAHVVTGDNDGPGWADAIRRYVLAP